MQISKGDIGVGSKKDANADPTRDEAPKPGEDEVSAWLAARTEAIKREDTYRKQAQKVVKIYEATEKSENSYNILYANTDTLSPALYSRVPRPQVERRFKDADKLGKAVAETTVRALEYLMDTDDAAYETFDSMMKMAVTSALVPGRGLFRWKYDDETDVTSGKVYRKICCEGVRWDRFHHGYAFAWKDVPWVGFDHFMTKEEVEDNFGKPIAAKLDFTTEAPEMEDEGGTSKRRASFGDDGVGKAKLCLVFEVWDKVKREVKFVSPGYKDSVLKRAEDPLSLTGFFPMAQPLQLIKKLSTLTPTPLYIFYEEQAKELNRITQRINKIVNQLKVRGIYDGRIGELEKVFQLNDGEMTPAESMDALDQAQKLDSAIWLMPLDKLVAVLQQLYLQRSQVKQVIFELTGIADIMRGSSAASETLGAQEIKERWGGIRLKRMQREVAGFACENLRIMSELVYSQLDEATLKAMTGLPFPTAEQKAQAQQVVQAAKMQQQQLQMQAQAQPTQPGPGGMAPPPSAAPDPRVAALAPLLEMPSWGEVITLGKSDQMRSYRIDIETNSTVELEMAEDKEDVKEMMMAFSQAIQGLAPLVQEGAMPWEAAKGTILAIARRFRFGREVEDLLMQMQAPQGNGEQAKQQAEMEKAKAEHQLEVEKHQADMAMEQQKAQLDQQTEQMKLGQAQEKMQADIQLAREKAMAEIQLAREKMQAEIALAERKAMLEADLARKQADFDHQLAEKNAQREAALAREKAAREAKQPAAKQPSR